MLAFALAAACFNETQLFCRGKKDDALVDCLARYESNLTPSCQSALGSRAPKGEPESVWGSKAAASGPSVDAAMTFSAAISEQPPAEGFELAIEDAPSFYPATGKTPAAVVVSMGGSGISDGVDGTKGAAATGGSLAVAYSRRKSAEGCSIEAAKLTAKVVQRLPRWDEPDAPPETRAWWDKEIAVIKTHEDGHRKINLDAARDALRYLESLGAFPDCDALARAIDGQLKRANVEAMQKNVAYDAATRHGQVQYEAAFGKP